MGIEHRMKDEEPQSRRCPCCLHLSTLSTKDGHDYYFYCQNPNCSAERIYGSNSVMMSGHNVVKSDDDS
jgi:hypothetical protein